VVELIIITFKIWLYDNICLKISTGKQTEVPHKRNNNNYVQIDYDF